MRRKTVMILLPLLIVALLIPLSGCSKKEGTLVAKVGDRKIYAQDLDDILNRFGVKFNSADEELTEKKRLLDTMINQDLLILGAYEHNLGNQEEVLRVVDGEKDKFLLDVLFDKHIMSKAVPSEAEIKDWYVRMGEEIKASHILVDSESTAQDILNKLKSGANFEELATQYSTDPSAKRNQGDLGWFTWGSMVDNFQEAAFRMKAGEVSAPVKTDFGYHVIKVVDRRKVEHQPSYTEAKDQIRTLITERRKRTLLQAYADELHKKYPITVEKPTCDFILKKLEYTYPDTIGTTPRWRNNFDVNQLSKEEKDLILGRYTGGQMTIGEYLTNIRRVPPDKQPDFDKEDSLKEMIFQMSFMNILTLEAKAEGLENTPEYKDKLSKFKELAMADVMRNDSIPYGADVNEGELQEYYDTHPADFTSPLRFNLIEIQVADSGMAMKYRSTIRTEQQFKDIAARETLRPGKREAAGELGVMTRTQYPELFDAVVNLKAGDVAGPIRSLGRFSVVWVKQRLEPELQPFNLVKGRIVEVLSKAKGDSLYNDWIKEMRKRITIEVYDDALAKSIDKEKYVSRDTTQTN
ncbi:MAG: peptidylprolyl isomerase [candidate division Zixibacteria bacterium]|nr:peptidylprolyl isomerase [candidate division Zixibacteria bacterium]